MKSPAEYVHAWLRLAPQERRQLVQAWGLLFAIGPVLRLFSFPRIHAYCRRVRPGHHNTTPTSPSRLAQLVEIAARYYPLPTSCLTEALALSWLMSRQGMTSTLRIGVAKGGDRLTAHAWVEQDGLILLGRDGSASHAPLLPLRP